MSKSLVIGSRPDCDLVVQAASVSGRHCRVSSDEAGYILEDLNSTNGTYFQGKRVSGSIRVALAEDDIIHLGSYALPASKVLASLDRSNASQFLLQTQEMVIGRGAGCDHVFDLPMVSSRHARIFRSGGQIWIEDLKSSNGTFVNDKRIDAATLIQPGDSLAMGSFKFVLDKESWKPLEVVERSTSPVALTAEAPAFPAPGKPQTDSQSTQPAETANGSFRDRWAIAALLAQALPAALAIAALSSSSRPAVLYGLGVAATWFGLSNGLASRGVKAMLEQYGWKGSALTLARYSAFVILCLAQCLIVWILAPSIGGGRNPGILALGILGLTSLVGLALGLVILKLFPRLSIVWASGGFILMLLCLLSGLSPRLDEQPAAVRPLSGLLPSRWAFESLLLLEERQPGPESDAAVTQSGLPEPAATYFPIASERMGLTADVLALCLMLIGLAATLAWLSSRPQQEQLAPSVPLASSSTAT